MIEASLAQFGIAGVSLGMMYKLASDHVKSNTEATKELAGEFKKMRQDMMHRQLVSEGRISADGRAAPEPREGDD